MHVLMKYKLMKKIYYKNNIWCTPKHRITNGIRFAAFRQLGLRKTVFGLCPHGFSPPKFFEPVKMLRIFPYRAQKLISKMVMEKHLPKLHTKQKKPISTITSNKKAQHGLHPDKSPLRRQLQHAQDKHTMIPMTIPHRLQARQDHQVHHHLDHLLDQVGLI